MNNRATPSGSQPNPEDDLRDWEQETVAKLVKARIEVAELERTLARIMRLQGRAETAPSPQVEQPMPSHQSPHRQPVEPEDSLPYAGMDIAEAAVEFLKQHSEPVALSRIHVALEEGGVQFRTAVPTVGIANALTRRMRNHRDVFKAGNNLWCFEGNYTPQKKRRIIEKHAGRGGASAEEHGSKTASAIRERVRKGQRWARQKLSAEKVKEIKDLMAAGMAGSRAAEQVGITKSRYYQLKDKIEAWNNGDPWPPWLAEDSDQSTDESPHKPALRVVNGGN